MYKTILNKLKLKKSANYSSVPFYSEGTFVGRVYNPKTKGPSIVSMSKDGHVYDLTHSKGISTVSHLLTNSNLDIAGVVKENMKRIQKSKSLQRGQNLGHIEEIMENSLKPEKQLIKLLSPVDLQSIKACGVTFITSLLERVIEEQAKGDPNKSHEIRKTFDKEIGSSLSNIKPGSEESIKLKEIFLKRNMWSQYLEVGLMKDCEVFTKAQPMSSVGYGSKIGILKTSTWNNPEPEVVLVINNKGKIVGSTLGNDVNLRDYEGRSALLLGKAKDNNASCSLGPFIRLFDSTFTLDNVRELEVNLSISGNDGFQMKGSSSMKEISRDIEELVSQTISKEHQYPDGLVLFTGTMFAPTMDRDTIGQGFTHKIGDFVKIENQMLGALVNTVDHCDKIEPWEFGLLNFYKYLSQRKLI
eukprot:gene2190-2054_t